MNVRVVALGSDKYWLQAIQRAMSDNPDRLEKVELHDDLQQDINNLPKPEPQSIVLLDVSQLKGPGQAMARIRAGGWKYVVAVAADPSVKEATAILRGNLGFDYWHKTYDESEIRHHVLACSEEILLLETLSKKEGFSTEAELIREIYDEDLTREIYGEDVTEKVAANDSRLRDLIVSRFRDLIERTKTKLERIGGTLGYLQFFPGQGFRLNFAFAGDPTTDAPPPPKKKKDK